MGYNQKYYKHHLDYHRVWEIPVAKYLVKKYSISSVLDLGCGVGSFLEGALESGVTRVSGIEIMFKVSSKYTPDSVIKYIQVGDMTQKLELEKFDCVWSFEAAEHIKPEGTFGFIDNIVTLANRLIILTAAHPGQRGTGHINCRPKEFWISEIEKREFVYNNAAVKTILNDFLTLEMPVGYKVPKYINQNIMLFEKKV